MRAVRARVGSAQRGRRAAGVSQVQEPVLEPAPEGWEGKAGAESVKAPGWVRCLHAADLR